MFETALHCDMLENRERHEGGVTKRLSRERKGAGIRERASTSIRLIFYTVLIESKIRIILILIFY